MRCNRDVVLELLCEIFRICNEKKLRCCLSGEFLIMPAVQKEIRREAPRGEVSMPFYDLCILAEELKKQVSENRNAEWFFDNENIKDICFSYVATDTMYYDIRYDKNCKYHGVRVLIKPVFDQTRFTKISNFLMNGWIQQIGSKAKKQNLENRILRFVFKKKPKMILNYLKRRLMKEQRNSSGNKCFTWSFNFRKKLKFDTNFWDDLVTVDLDGISVCVPKNLDEYANVLHGRNWKDKNYNKDYLNYLSNSGISYKMFFDEADMNTLGNELSEAVDSRRKKKNDYNKVNAPFKSSWENFYTREIGWRGKEEENY